MRYFKEFEVKLRSRKTFARNDDTHAERQATNFLRVAQKDTKRNREPKIVCIL